MRTFLLSGRWTVVGDGAVSASDADRKVTPSTAADVIEGALRRDSNSTEGLQMYEYVSGSRLSAPSALELEQAVKPALREAFRRGDLVMIDGAEKRAHVARSQIWPRRKSSS